MSSHLSDHRAGIHRKGRKVTHDKQEGSAGSAGAQCVAALRLSGQFDPVAFLDDDTSLQGSIVAGVEVFPPSDLRRLIEEESAKVLMLALPSQSRRRRQEILKSLEPFAVRVMTVPDISALLSGTARVEDVRDVESRMRYVYPEWNGQ